MTPEEVANYISTMLKPSAEIMEAIQRMLLALYDEAVETGQQNAYDDPPEPTRNEGWD